MKNKKINILNFSPMTHGYRLKFILSFILIITSVTLTYLTPQVVRVTVDSVIGSKPFDLPVFMVNIIENLGGRDFLVNNIIFCAIASFVLAVTAALCDFGARFNLVKACEGTLEVIRNKLFAHVQILPYNWHNEHQTGDIIQRCTMDVDVIKTFVSEQLQGLIRTVLLIAIALSLMFPMSVELTLITLIFIPITLVYSIIFYIRVGRKFQEADECEGALSSIAQENLTAVRVVRAFGREKFEVDKFNATNKEFANIWVKLGSIMGLNWGIGDFISFIQIITIITAGTFFAIDNKITLGEFIVFVSYNTMLVWPIRNLGRILSELSKTTISSTRLFDILNSEPEKDCDNPIETEMKGDIEFKNVSFNYTEFSNTIEDISFKLNGGKTLGILGSTGSGKSTLMYLLDRLYELPKENGTITIGGVDIRDLSLAYLRKNIGFVLQEPFLFSKSFKESIAEGSTDTSLSKVREYADLAVIDHTISNFAEGYDTQIGERGVTISGGQKQRVAIARMLMQDTPIKIFDDSLSAVDMETDAKIRHAINTKVKGTTIIITHRITTIQNADMIIVLEKGKIAQMGNHNSLTKEDGIYKKIYDSQIAKEED